MRRWIVGAALLLGLLAPSGARAASPANPFEKLVVLHPAYQGVRRLEQHGYFTGSPEGTFDGKRELTRYEFALAVERIYRSLQPRILEATDPKNLRQDLSTFRELLKEFEPEIAALGTDVGEIQRQADAMAERVARLEKSARDPAEPETGLNSDRILSAALSRPREYGIRGALRKPYLQDALGADRLDLTRVPIRPGPSAAAVRLGSAQLSVQLQRPNSLHTVDHLPLENPADALSFGSELSSAFGKYLLTAFYSRESGLADPFSLWNPYVPATGLKAVGGSFSGPISDSLGFQLETATFSSLGEDPSRMVYLRGGVDYRLTGRLRLLLGYEWLRGIGASDGIGGSAYVVGFRQALGQNAGLDFLYRRYNSGLGGGPGDLGNSSAITQISIRF